jgi:hypothetical protein
MRYEARVYAEIMGNIIAYRRGSRSWRCEKRKQRGRDEMKSVISRVRFKYEDGP